MSLEASLALAGLALSALALVGALAVGLWTLLIFIEYRRSRRGRHD